MTNLEDFLQQIGLSKSEVSLYLIGLTMPQATVSQLTIATKLKRPTVYHGLNALVEKGLTTEVKEAKELQYTMRSPDHIEEYINGQVGAMQQQASLLGDLISQFPEAPKTAGQPAIIQHFTGIQQVRELIDKALYCSSHHWDIVAPRQNFIAESDEAYIRHFKQVRKQQNIQSCTLWEGKWEQGKISLADVMHRKPRYLPREYDGRFKAMMILFDKKVAFIGSYAQQEALLIESKEIHDFQQMLFEALWAQAKKP